MTTLARQLRITDYFALAFGTMIGAGWLVLMDDWLGRSGPLGAILGFATGGLLLLPVGYVYGQWVQRLPDAAGEAAYTAQVFPPIVSYFTGWRSEERRVGKEISSWWCTVMLYVNLAV